MTIPYHSSIAESVSNTAKSGAGAAGGILGIAGMADWLEGNGFDRAEAAAGDVLRPLFGGQLPWEMSAGEIFDAVVPDFLPDFIPGAADSATAMIAPGIDVALHLF